MRFLTYTLAGITALLIVAVGYLFIETGNLANQLSAQQQGVPGPQGPPGPPGPAGPQGSSTAVAADAVEMLQSLGCPRPQVTKVYAPTSRVGDDPEFIDAVVCESNTSGSSR